MLTIKKIIVACLLGLLSACGGGGNATATATATAPNGAFQDLAANLGVIHAAPLPRPEVLEFRVVNTAGVKCALLAQNSTLHWDAPLKGQFVLFDDWKDGKELCYLSFKGETESVVITVKNADGSSFPGSGLVELDVRDTYNTNVLNPSSVVVPVPTLSRDSDGDGTPDVSDSDDDNDGTLDNDDYRPLDNTIQTVPTFTGRVNSYEQTYVREDNPNTNYSNQSTLLVRSIAGSFATAGLLYFDIPATLNGKRTDNITKATLTLKSDTEQDTVKFYASTNPTFPSAATANWNNTQPLFGSTLYGQVAMAAGTSGSVVLSQAVVAGKIVFVVDETGLFGISRGFALLLPSNPLRNNRLELASG